MDLQKVNQEIPALDQLTMHQLNLLRLQLRPAQSTIESFRNLILLFQGTEDWITIPNCETAPWSRLVQQLLKPKRLLRLLQNHANYDLSINFSTINSEILDINENNEIEEILNQVVCYLIGYHNPIISDPPQVSRVTIPESNTFRAQEILNELQEQINNSRVGEYVQLYQYKQK